MTFSLHVDGERWRQHMASVRDDVREALHNGKAGARFGDIVPVAKGNGYGFGVANLALESARLGLDRDRPAAGARAERAGDALLLADEGGTRGEHRLARGDAARQVVARLGERSGGQRQGQRGACRGEMGE